jgi:hypothetical protein
VTTGIGPSSGDRLTLRAINRATLDRQMFLRRHTASAAHTLEHLVGMQAQAPHAPYVGLWTRLHGFTHAELADMVADRRAVRVPLMRTTIHLVTARDCLALRPVVQPVLERGFYTGSPFGRTLAGMDVEAVLAVGRRLLEEAPRSTAQMGTLLHAHWPDRDAASLAHAVRYLVPLVQLPPRGIWGAGGAATWTTVEGWLGRPIDTHSSPDALVLRYLAAFGPATVQDVRAWSWLTGLTGVMERLRPQLQTFRDEQGRELFDLPNAPRPDPQTPAPPRFLPAYDNLLVSYADRSRFMAPHRKPPLFPGNGGDIGSVLVDGWFCGTWKVVHHGDTAALRIELFEKISAADRGALEEEGMRLLAFVAGDAGEYDIEFAAVG